jgi:hypothetical protein
MRGLLREQHLEKKTERIHVAGQRGDASGRLFRTHGGRRTDRQTALGELARQLRGGRGMRAADTENQRIGCLNRLFLSGGRSCWLILFVVACDAEVQHLYGAVHGDHYVFLFEVAMNDAFAMCGGQRVADLERDAQLARAAHPHLDGLLQGYAIDQLEDEKIAFFGLYIFINAANVRMVERRKRARLA